MLILSRKKGESIIIDGNIEISVAEIEGDKVKLAFSAPKEISILRQEIYIQILNENKNASEYAEGSVNRLNRLFKKNK